METHHDRSLRSLALEVLLTVLLVVGAFLFLENGGPDWVATQVVGGANHGAAGQSVTGQGAAASALP